MELSEQELKDLGLDQELWEDWQMIMNSLWMAIRNMNIGKVINGGENTIKWALSKDAKFEILCNFINREWLEVQVLKNGTLMLQIRYDKNIDKIVHYVLSMALVSDFFDKKTLHQNLYLYTCWLGTQCYDKLSTRMVDAFINQSKVRFGVIQRG